MGDATDQVIAPIWKLYPATSHAEQYIINSRYCGNLLWQSGLTLYHTARRTLQKRFRSVTGETLKSWTERQRLAAAQTRLRDGASFRDAALSCGYGSARALTKAFRRFANTSFRAWRTSL